MMKGLIKDNKVVQEKQTTTTNMTCQRGPCVCLSCRRVGGSINNNNQPSKIDLYQRSLAMM